MRSSLPSGIAEDLEDMGAEIWHQVAKILADAYQAHKPVSWENPIFKAMLRKGPAKVGAGKKKKATEKLPIQILLLSKIMYGDLCAKEGRDSQTLSDEYIAADGYMYNVLTIVQRETNTIVNVYVMLRIERFEQAVFAARSQEESNREQWRFAKLFVDALAPTLAAGMGQPVLH